MRRAGGLRARVFKDANEIRGGWMRRFLAGVGVMAAALAVAALAGSGLRTVAAQDAANKPAFYTEKVRPLLQTNCG
jgi:hypothetical protein